MTGGIIQLVATGVADLYLTGNPQITWFKTTYRRHTEFGICDMNIKIKNNLEFGSTKYFTITHMADLLNRLTIIIDLPSPSKYIKTKNTNDEITKILKTSNINYNMPNKINEYHINKLENVIKQKYIQQ